MENRAGDFVDYYEVLQVSQNASKEVISAAYRRLSKLNHPDAGGSETNMRILNEAYEILIDDEKRQQYDLNRGICDKTNVEPAKPWWKNYVFYYAIVFILFVAFAREGSRGAELRQIVSNAIWHTDSQSEKDWAEWDKAIQKWNNSMDKIDGLFKEWRGNYSEVENPSFLQPFLQSGSDRARNIEILNEVILEYLSLKGALEKSNGPPGADWYRQGLIENVQNEITAYKLMKDGLSQESYDLIRKGKELRSVAKLLKNVEVRRCMVVAV